MAATIRSVLVSLVVVSPVLCSSGPARAFCRSTTCDDGAEDCPRDEDGCKTTGQPLWWGSLCVGYSMQQDGTRWIDMERVLPEVRASIRSSDA